MQGIMAINVERRLRLSVPLSLGILQHGGELGSFMLHPGKDVIACPIDDAIQVSDPVADKAFPKRLDDGYTAADACFVIKIGLIALRGCKQFFAASRQQ